MKGHIVGLWIGQRENGMSTEPGDTQSGHAPGTTEQQAFNEDLTDDSESGRAQSHSNGYIYSSSGGAGQQQTGDVRAGHEQHHAGENHQEAQIGAGLLLEFLDSSPSPCKLDVLMGDDCGSAVLGESGPFPHPLPQY